MNTLVESFHGVMFVWANLLTNLCIVEHTNIEILKVKVVYNKIVFKKF